MPETVPSLKETYVPIPLIAAVAQGVGANLVVEKRNWLMGWLFPLLIEEHTYLILPSTARVKVSELLSNLFRIDRPGNLTNPPCQWRAIVHVMFWTAQAEVDRENSVFLTWPPVAMSVIPDLQKFALPWQLACNPQEDEDA